MWGPRLVVTSSGVLAISAAGYSCSGQSGGALAVSPVPDAGAAVTTSGLFPPAQVASDGQSIVLLYEGGTKFIVQSSVPVCLAVDKGINTPRYASLPGIMKAKKKEIKGYALSDLGLNAGSAKVKESDYQPPPERADVQVVDARTQAPRMAHVMLFSVRQANAGVGVDHVVVGIQSNSREERRFTPGVAKREVVAIAPLRARVGDSIEGVDGLVAR